MKRLKHMAGQFRIAFLALVVVFIILLCALMVVGCTNDDDADALPSYTAVLAEAITDRGGHIRTLRDDNGRIWTITNVDTTSVSPNTPDSLYRVRAWVIPDDAEPLHLKVIRLDWLFSYKPQRFANMMVKHDPVENVSATITPRYVNMRLAIRASKIEAHRYGFVEESILKDTDGTKTLTISLYHDNGGDTASYTVEDVFSCPIYPYFGTLIPGRDKVRLVVHTKGQPFTQEWVIPKLDD